MFRDDNVPEKKHHTQKLLGLFLSCGGRRTRRSCVCALSIPPFPPLPIPLPNSPGHLRLNGFRTPPPFAIAVIHHADKTIRRLNFTASARAGRPLAARVRLLSGMLTCAHTDTRMQARRKPSELTSFMPTGLHSEAGGPN